MKLVNSLFDLYKFHVHGIIVLWYKQVMLVRGNVLFHVESAACCFKIIQDNQQCQHCGNIQHLKRLAMSPSSRRIWRMTISQ